MTDWQGAEERDRRRAEQTEKDKAARRQLLEDMAKILATPGGKRVFTNILTHCRLRDSNFTGNSETFKLEGKREVALTLTNWMEQADPDATRQIIGDIYVRRSDEN